MRSLDMCYTFNQFEVLAKAPDIEDAPSGCEIPDRSVLFGHAGNGF
jgi:hypothetical protein